MAKKWKKRQSEYLFIYIKNYPFLSHVVTLNRLWFEPNVLVFIFKPPYTLKTSTASWVLIQFHTVVKMASFMTCEKVDILGIWENKINVPVRIQWFCWEFPCVTCFAPWSLEFTWVLHLLHCKGKRGYHRHSYSVNKTLLFLLVC